MGNYPTLGAGCKLFLNLALLLFTRLRAPSFFALCKNRDSLWPERVLLCSRDLLPLLLSNNLQQSKSIMAPVSVMKSVPIIPSDSVGSKHTKNVCFNSRPFNRNETVCRPFVSRISQVTPYVLTTVTLVSLLEIRGCNIDNLNLCLKSDFSICLL